MKRLILGDMHGHFSTIREIYDKENPDEVIILGDYVDSFGVGTEEIYEAFGELVKLRLEHLDKNKGNFILLLGNHDFHYIVDTEKYSGWNWRTESWARKDILEMVNKNIIKFCYIDKINKTIYSHAGVSNTWLNETCVSPLLHPAKATIDEINSLPLNLFKFDRTEYNIYGDTIYQGPLWIRPYSLSNDMYKDEEGIIWTQIVGHTHVGIATWYADNKLLVLDSLPKYYCIEELDDKGILIKREIIKNF